jgi:hypothetical protein
VAHPSHRVLASLNAFNERVFVEMSLARKDGAPEYIVTRTRLRTPMYDGAVPPLLEALGICSFDDWRASGSEGLVVLRSTVMDPFFDSKGSGPDHIAGYVAALRRACTAAIV